MSGIERSTPRHADYRELLSSLDDLASGGDSLCRDAAEAIRALQRAPSETKRDPGPMPKPPFSMNCEEAQAWKVGWYTGAYGHPPVVKL